VRRRSGAASSHSATPRTAGPSGRAVFRRSTAFSTLRRKPGIATRRVRGFRQDFADTMNAFKSIIKPPGSALNLVDVQLFILAGGRKYLNNILQRNLFTLK
jgi:hypothetical protein